MGKKEKQKTRQGWGGIAATLFALLVLVAGTGWRIHLQGLEIRRLEKELANAVGQEARARSRKRQALLCVSALGELQGWRQASPFTSSIVAELASLPDALRLQDCLLERQISLRPLADGAAGPWLPPPFHAIHLTDTASLSVYETKKGGGGRALPGFLSEMNKKTGCAMACERGSLDPRWEEPGTGRVAGRCAWHLSTELPPRPLWCNILEQP